MNPWKLLSVSMAMTFLFHCSPPPPFANSPGKAAQNALDAFKQGMDDSVAAALGFKDAADGRSSRLGSPIRVFDIACSSVMKAKTDSAQPFDPRSIAQRETYLFPLQDSLKTNRSLILVGKLNKGEGYGKEGYWSPLQVGAKPLMRQLDSALKLPRIANERSLFLAQAPVLGAAFLGFEVGREVHFTPAALGPLVDSCMNYPDRNRDLPAGRLLAALGRCFDAKLCEDFDPAAHGIKPTEVGPK